MMADGAQPMFLTGTSVSEIAHASSDPIGNLEVMAANRLGSEQLHDGAPLRTVGSDATTVHGSGHQMGGFMRHGLLQEVDAVVVQQCAIVSDRHAPLGGKHRHSRRLAGQVEPNIRLGNATAKVTTGPEDELPGLFKRLALEICG